MAELTVIANIHNDFPEKFGIPRQSGLVQNLPSRIIFTENYRNIEALRGLEAFSHIWLLWGFSAAKSEHWSPTVRPPRLGGNTRMGVFATRSPYRPNSIGLSSVKIEKIELHSPDGPVLHVLGADLMDNTPIYDIKPYLAFTDSHPDALGGFAVECEKAPLDVQIDEAFLARFSESEAQTLRALLAQDPRPSYQEDEGRLYGMAYKDMDIKFTVSGGVLTVREIIRLKA